MTARAPEGGAAELRERDARFLARHAAGAWFEGTTIRENNAIGGLYVRGYIDRGTGESYRVNDAGRAYLAGRGRSFRRTTARLAASGTGDVPSGAGRAGA